MKIAFICKYSGNSWDGSEELWYEAANKALEDKHEVFIFLKQRQIIAEQFYLLEKRGAKLFFHSKLSDNLNYFQRKVKRLFQVLKLYKEANPFLVCEKLKVDLICVSQGKTFDSILNPDLMDFLINTHIPYVLISQQNDERYYLSDQNFENVRYLVSKAKCFYFVSKKNLELAKSQLVLDNFNYKVLLNPAKTLSNISIPFPYFEIPKFATLSRLNIYEKGLDILLKVLSKKKWLEREWKLSIFGDGINSKTLEMLISHLNLSEKVHLMGFASDLNKVWASHQLLLLPSRVEGSSLALLEAMACGRPALVTDTGGNAEIVKNGYNGFVASYPTEEHLDLALENAWITFNQWRELGENASISIRGLYKDSKSFYDEVITNI
ncbi:MAG: glycosyltransferase [Chloroherpetonaceae bacterium]|nr:glycosyltransferase [Chloroherpetonaceae bacterium]